MQNYPLIKMNQEGTLFHPQHSSCSDEYCERMCNLYLSDQVDMDDKGKPHKHYRLHAKQPHRMEDYLAYDIMCPKCSKLLKPIGRPINYNELGLYTCPYCDKK